MRIVAAILLIIIVTSSVGCATSLSNTDKTEPYEVSFHVYVQQWTMIHGEYAVGWHVYKNPVGQVTIKNIDTIKRTFKVEITHFYGDETYTKEYSLQLEPEQAKTVRMSYLADVKEVSDFSIHETLRGDDWSIDYQVTPI